jgi:hypothetical protein
MEVSGMSKRSLALITSGIFCWLSSSEASQMSNLYGSYNSSMYVVSDSGTASWAFKDSTGALTVFAIDGTIKTATSDPGAPGREYSLTGEVLDGVYPNLLKDGRPFGLFADGATDAVHNYSVTTHIAGGNVYQFTTEWDSAQFLFSTGYKGSLGIAFDNITNTLWISSTGDHYGADPDDNNNFIRNYDLTGNLLYSIDASQIEGRHEGLAIDYMTNTLWLSSESGLTELTKSGEILRTIHSDAPYGFSALETDYANASTVPEPTSVALFSLGAIGIGFIGRKRKA